jgi:hypothetical protein
VLTSVPSWPAFHNWVFLPLTQVSMTTLAAEAVAWPAVSTHMPWTLTVWSVPRVSVCDAGPPTVVCCGVVVTGEEATHPPRSPTVGSADVGSSMPPVSVHAWVSRWKES